MAKKVSIRSGATALPEESVAHLTHDLVYQSGVYSLSSDHFKVYENNPQNLSVNVSPGRAYFKKTIITYHGYSDAVENLSISANNSGNPRIDAVVLWVDLATTPNSDASNILKLSVVTGTPASTPVAPSNNEIQTSIGAGNPFVRLANIYVANGASTITNSNITDTRVSAYFKISSDLFDTFLKSVKIGGSYQNIYETSGSGTINLDCQFYNVFRITMTGNITLTLSNMQVGQFIQVDLKQDATGSRTCSWFSGISWPDGVEPVLTATPNKTDSFVIKKVGSNSYLGYIAGQNL
jgi:hypothetical protein